MKRIVTCSDGTWNKPDCMDRGVAVKTNVEIMYLAIQPFGEDGMKQVKYYDQGVGTGTSFFDKIFGGISGSGIDKNIMDAYKFIMWNFEPGDEIYLFGFSRGAYTARSLGGFIRNCGVMKMEYLHLVGEAYQLYRDHTRLTHPDSDYMKSFRSAYSNNTRIKFVGVWDTVGSLGIPLRTIQFFNKDKYRFHDCTLSSIIENAFHALAIDEKRKLFAPTLWEKSKTAMENPAMQTLEQRWFAGVHSNIGGGYKDRGLSDLAFNWIKEKAKSVGLNIDNAKCNDLLTDTLYEYPLNPDFRGELRDSVTPLFYLSPRQRRSILEDENKGETIDETVNFRIINKIEGYNPPNLPKDYFKRTAATVTEVEKDLILSIR